LTTEFIAESFKENWKIVKAYPKPTWQHGMNTQARNISAGIDYVSHSATSEDIIFIIEDDDYYKPIYLERMVFHMGDFKVIGETNTIYYNVITRRYADNQNRQHASLFQIAFKPEMVPIFLQTFKAKFIDCTFFSLIDKNLVNLFHDGTLAVGIKGIQGRGGIGAGHSPAFTANNDYSFGFLKSIIGEDSEKYKHYFNGIGSIPQRRVGGRPLFSARRY